MLYVQYIAHMYFAIALVLLYPCSTRLLCILLTSYQLWYPFTLYVMLVIIYQDGGAVLYYNKVNGIN